MSRIALHLLSGIATTLLGATLVLIGNYKTPVEEVVSPYSTDQTVVSFVGLPPRLSAISNILGCLSLVVGGGYCGYKILEELDPVLKQLAAPPMASNGSFDVPPISGKVRSVAAPQSQPQVEEYQSTVPPRVLPPSIYAQPLEVDYESRVEPIRYAQPNTGLVASVPEEVNILDAAAETNSHILIATKTGAGKTTTLLAIIFKVYKRLEGKVQFFIVDPKGSSWLGLENIKNTYRTRENRVVATPAVQYPLGMDIQPAIDQIQIVYDLLVCRIEKKDKDVEDHIYLIIDEWLSVYSTAQLGNARLFNFLKLMVNTILNQGREYKVHLVIVGQSHYVTDCGFSSAIRQSFGVLCQGRVGQKKDVGYAPVTKAIKDKWLIDVDDAPNLLLDFQKAVRLAAEQNDRPVIMSTMGSPRIGLAEDFSWLKGTVIFEPTTDSSNEQDDQALDLTREFYDYTHNRDKNDFGAE